MATFHYTATVRADRSLELPQEAHGLLTPGQEIEIDLTAGAMHIATPNERALATLRLLADMKKGMRETDGSQTDRMIREGRSGGMYDHAPIE